MVLVRGGDLEHAGRPIFCVEALNRGDLSGSEPPDNFHETRDQGFLKFFTFRLP